MAGGESLDIARNLDRYYREHEKFYARRPLQEAAVLEQTSAALRALAEHWSTAKPDPAPAANAFAGAEDLNDERATELAGIVFTDGGQEPADITRIKNELKMAAEDNQRGGAWLAAAMDASWTTAEALLSHPELADVLSERHRIIVNDWHAAALATLTGRSLERAAAILNQIDFSARSLRDDLDGSRISATLLHAACDLIDHAADLAAQSGVLIDDNQRCWRRFRQRVDELPGAAPQP